MGPSSRDLVTIRLHLALAAAIWTSSGAIEWHVVPAWHHLARVGSRMASGPERRLQFCKAPVVGPKNAWVRLRAKTHKQWGLRRQGCALSRVVRLSGCCLEVVSQFH